MTNLRESLAGFGQIQRGKKKCEMVFMKTESNAFN
jgi:hypothetical protein